MGTRKIQRGHVVATPRNEHRTSMQHKFGACSVWQHNIDVLHHGRGAMHLGGCR